MPSHDHDLLVIGSGQGGLPAAHMAANLGARLALVRAHRSRRHSSQRGARPHREEAQ
ncbi:MAG: FAD-binding protein [Thermoanaerobaculia bacterium]|nr:FAD-binding protein [Thermoanaerobaculia bacterium]